MSVSSNIAIAAFNSDHAEVRAGWYFNYVKLALTRTLSCKKGMKVDRVGFVRLRGRSL